MGPSGLLFQPRTHPCLFFLVGPLEDFRVISQHPVRKTEFRLLWGLLMWRTSYKGVRKTDKAIRRQWNTCRAAGTEGQREDVVFREPRCSLQAGSREEGAACWELEPQRWCQCSQRCQRKQREQKKKFPEVSLLSWSDTMSVPHLRQTDSEARQAGEPGMESAAVNAEIHREQWRAEQWVLEQEGNDSHTWESLLALGARRFPLTQLKPFLFFWGSGFWNSKSGRDSFLWISSKTNRELARAGEKCKKLKTHGSYFSNVTPSPVLLRDHCHFSRLRSLLPIPIASWLSFPSLPPRIQIYFLHVRKVTSNLRTQLLYLMDIKMDKSVISHQTGNIPHLVVLVPQT